MKKTYEKAAVTKREKLEKIIATFVEPTSGQQDL